MAVHLYLATNVSSRSTPTIDEIAHLPAGISYVEKQTFAMYHHNPPLARILPALAAMTAGPNMHYEGTWKNHDPPSHWFFGLGFIVVNNPERYFASYARGRAIISLWSALTIPVLYLWGAWWFGRRSGWLAAGLWTICPNIVAHAGVVTTDLAATSMGLIACHRFARWLDQPSWPRAMLAGLFLGLALLVKFSSLWLILLWPAWALLHVWSQSRSASEPLGGTFITTCRRLAPWNVVARPQGRMLLLLVAVCGFTVNAGYLFEGTLTRLDQFQFVSASLTRPRLPSDPPPRKSSNVLYNQVYRERTNRFVGTLLGAVPFPLPYHFLTGFDEQKYESEGKYQMYLAGRFADEDTEDTPPRRRGWWYYYVYALAIKVPISTWILVTMSAVGAFVWPVRRGPTLVPLWILAAFPVAAISLGTDINIGLRYVLPAFPFLFLIASSAVQPGRPAWWNGAPIALIAWNVVALARIHPHELAYFNELVGGPTQARFHLIDSNIDWGQDLRGLARWLDTNPDWRAQVRIAYMGSVPPEFEGIRDYRLAPRDLRFVPEALRLPWEREEDPTSHGPQPGKFAVSVNLERGLQFDIPCPIRLVSAILAKNPGALSATKQLLFSPQNAYAYFQHFTPTIVPEVGYSILLYDISLEDANRARREMGLPLLAE